jgi:putative ABC transport system permease protein
VSDVRHAGRDETVSQQVYVPERQWYGAESNMALVVRVDGDPKAVIEAIEEAVRSVDPLQPITRIATMDNVVARSTAQRLGATMFVSFGMLALLLAGAGIYGVLAVAVTARTREIGVRAALGATPRRISVLVLRQAGALVLTGVVLGAAVALALARYLQSLLFRVQPSDPVALVIAGLGVAAAALLATMPPMLRASRVDPVEALRGE